VISSFFFDTSALIKLYHEEVGTEKVEDWFLSAQTAGF